MPRVENEHELPFEEIPGDILRSRWKVCWKGRWRDPEAMPILEGSCALLAFKHLLRNTRNLPMQDAGHF
eukprot:5496135-Amphidinium_carterae.1